MLPRSKRKKAAAKQGWAIAETLSVITPVQKKVGAIVNRKRLYVLC